MSSLNVSKTETILFEWSRSGLFVGKCFYKADTISRVSIYYADNTERNLIVLSMGSPIFLFSNWYRNRTLIISLFALICKILGSFSSSSVTITPNSACITTVLPFTIIGRRVVRSYWCFCCCIQGFITGPSITDWHDYRATSSYTTRLVFVVLRKFIYGS